MSFEPKVSQELAIDGVTYRIAEHPAAPGIPYGQEGRQAIVYQLVAESGEKKALKVFKPRYRLPALVSLANRIAPYAELPGLQVCHRTVLIPQCHAPLLRQHMDLTYAVLMPSGWKGPRGWKCCWRGKGCRQRRAWPWPARWPRCWPQWNSMAWLTATSLARM